MSLDSRDKMKVLSFLWSLYYLKVVSLDEILEYM
jgi:hypothetical protein